MGALAEKPGDRRISFGREDDCLLAVSMSSDVWTGVSTGKETETSVTTSNPGAIATLSHVESLDALRAAATAEAVPAGSATISVEPVLEPVGTSTSGTSAIADTSMEGSLEAPRASTESLSEPPPVNESSMAPPESLPEPPVLQPVDDSSMDSDVVQRRVDEGISRLFALSLRALTRRPSSPIRLPPSAPRAMRSSVPARMPPLPVLVVPPPFAARLADPSPFWTRTGPMENSAVPSQSRMPPPRPVLLDRLSSEAPAALLLRFSTPPPIEGPSLLHRMGNSATRAAPPPTKRPKARRGMRGGETARQLRTRRAERERLLALEQSATPVASSSSAPPTFLAARLQPSVHVRAAPVTGPRYVASTSSTPPTSLAARLQPSVQVSAAPVTSPLSEMDQALMEADWTLTQVEAAAPLYRMDLDTEDEVHTRNDLSM
ncbi:hypothetical protein GGX14DRAFT_563117 [Mycena pura]|uniref:Uncharacterized protein n=1 Tax=Mycena pura TaxID=153505 RepID=A0AAD6VLG1_9AGAR|nr:hypothetical protein GGX14DRAFT_563117 [Mycena pura]